MVEFRRLSGTTEDLLGVFIEGGGFFEGSFLASEVSGALGRGDVADGLAFRDGGAARVESSFFLVIFGKDVDFLLGSEASGGSGGVFSRFASVSAVS